MLDKEEGNASHLSLWEARTIEHKLFILMTKGNLNMKFDITRAWKDEAYRQTLSEEELQSLPAHPAGEVIDETELAEVFGGDMPDVGMGAVGAASSASSSSRHTHSFSLLCDINVFSLDAHVIAIDHLLGIAECEKQICINRN